MNPNDKQNLLARTRTLRPNNPRALNRVKQAIKQPTAVSGDPKLVKKQSERTVLCTFTDKQGRVVRQVYGRGNGHSGDYGWAHIYRKHVLGRWYNGGTITTFSKALGTKTPDEVAELVGKSITQDSNPVEQGNDRRTYSYTVPGTNRDVFTVVDSNGTIITSYPVQHGRSVQPRNFDARQIPHNRTAKKASPGIRQVAIRTSAIP